MLLPKAKLAIVDDHPIIIEGLLKVLEKRNEFEVVGAFNNGHDFISFFKKSPVNIVLLEVALPDISGIDLCKKIKLISPNTIVVALSNLSERNAIMKMLENGSSGYLLKNTSVDELIISINDTLNGQIVFSPAVKQIIAKPQHKEDVRQSKLTPREIEIVKLIAQGITTQHIADKLFLSKFTVQNHRKNILQKLQVKNVAALINKATQEGLL